jgi:tRNA threonylcarbamoyl adenosine modification protein (Sua5/YciO/YrdC/YwlC family)
MNIKKVVIAAAGEGTRMLHLTNGKPKHLINVKKRPFLAYLLDNLFVAGYRDLILIVGYKQELIKEFLEKYKPPLKSLRKSQYKIRMVSQYEVLGPKSKIYGTACPLMCVSPFRNHNRGEIVGKSQFVYLCGDNLYSARDLKEINTNGKYNYLAGVYNKNPEKYGVLVRDKEFLKKIVEKPKDFVGNLINVGLYKFTYEIFEKLEKIQKSPRGEYEITDAVNLLAKDKKVKIKTIKDYWLDFGNPADVIRISYFLKSFKKFKNFFWKQKRFETISFRARDVVEKTIKFLERGQIIVSPTDTVYGLLADAENDKAVEKIYEMKQRDKRKAMPVFVKDIEMAKKIAKIDKKTERLLGEIWPGKITIVLNRKEKSGLSKLLFGKKKTIALRIPNHKLVLEIIKKIDKPLIGTSANISGKGSSTKIKEILEQFEKQDIKPDLVLDAGDLSENLPSTIIDFSNHKPKILRR